jgi:hypothetical protein
MNQTIAKGKWRGFHTNGSRCWTLLLSNRRKDMTKKGKGVPIHAMEAHGGRGGIAPTHT